MASPKKAIWTQAGSPYKVAAPNLYVVHYCTTKRIPNLGTLGNQAHLDATPPEDHTPYSDTAWPNRLPLTTPVDGTRYWVCASDHANEHGLGDAILRDARAGLLPWLKYMNVAGRSYAYADGFQHGAPNGDQHIHLSTFDDPDSLMYDPTGWDPLAGIPPLKEEPEMRWLIRAPGNPAVYLSDGLTRRWLQDGPEYKFWLTLLGPGHPIVTITADHLNRIPLIGAAPPK